LSKIKVFVIDDSAVFRELLAKELEKEPEFEVVGRAADPIIAKKLLAGSRPDVVTLDVEMPRQDGLSFLSELMAENPIPVVMISSLTDAGCAATLRAFELGAVDAIAKPRDGDLAELGRRVRDAVRAAASSRPRPPSAGVANLDPATPQAAPRPATTKLILSEEQCASRIVAIGASTGGTEALKEVLAALPRMFPPIVIVQHMPDGFTGHFAKSLSQLSRIQVIEAPKEDVTLRPGLAVLAHGGLHLLVHGEAGRLVAQVRDGPPVRNHKPSVDVLFTSVAKAAGNRALGVILTGMGDDGARGMLKMKESGAVTIAQDAASCVVYGMPKRAVELGGVERTVNLDHIGVELVRSVAR
jgi:two-component system chemotaxis response regulator CheB